jgi:hypothetical protein
MTTATWEKEDPNNPHVDEETAVLEALAGECKRRYTQLRRTFYGQPKYSPGPRWDGQFLKLAEILQKNEYGLDFIDVQFQSMGMVMPTPMHISSGGAVQRYRNYLDKVDQSQVCSGADGTPGTMELERARRFQYESNFIVNRKKIGRNLEDILMHRGSPICALTRFCVAMSAGLIGVAQVYRLAALAQLSLHSDYYEIYGDLLPEDVRAKRK